MMQKIEKKVQVFLSNTVHKYNLYRRISDAWNTSLLGMRIELFKAEFRWADRIEKERFYIERHIYIYINDVLLICNNYVAQT